MKNSLVILFSLTLSLTACTSRRADFNNASGSITISDLENYVSELGSDRFMGRKPFTEGEIITVNYLADQLQQIGFEPAFGGSYFQEVPMVEISSSVDDR